MTKFTVNNGQRVEVPFAIGLAGLVISGETAQLSFVPKGPQPRPGTQHEIDGATYEVLSVAPSKAVKGLGLVVANLLRKEANG